MQLVFLHGPPASGKLTIARELAGTTGFALFHNHLIVDAVAAVFPFGSDAFVRLREAFWLATLGEAARAGRSTIFTFQPEPTVAPDFAERVRRVVGEAGGEVIFVRLTLAADLQDARIANADRAAFGKMRSLELLRALRDQFEAAEAAMPPARLTIDTGATPPTAVARLIAGVLESAGPAI
ncbi:shikimate kinase [Phreatobacter stygius]|uniref:Shikimate kinase n=1 Tax=Phreatobacter stygius TaxID=1940610 RepID=A0A4D7BC27_9HYPH|nr:shikimate kinase [Phreatobacter stygius]QCI66946.1 shikimate kinase [Phreatobacter stygius]